MATNAQINILINAAQSAKTLGDLDKALGDINDELKGVEIGSDAFVQLKKAADDTAQSINNINISGFDKQLKGFEATSKTISSSLALSTGAMALFGSESEAAAVAIQRVQGALAISTAFRDFAEAQKAASESGNLLNKTLLANPFILIIGLLLPLISQMKGFEDIMKSLGNIASDLMKALKPLIDAFMMLLNSVFKALLPIIKTLADLLVKALAPVLKVITSVVKALNPLFKLLGDFLSENSVFVEALTFALELALLPLNLLVSGLEAIGLVDTTETETGLEDIGTAANEAASGVAVLSDNLEDIFGTVEAEKTAVEDTIKLLQAKGATQEEIERVRRRAVEKELSDTQKLKSELRGKYNLIRAGLGNNEEELNRLNTLIADADKRIADANLNLQILDANDTRRRSEANKKRLEELRKTQEQLEKGYLSLRDIEREISEEFIRPEDEPFLGFFVDYRKRLSELKKEIETLPEETRQPFQEFLKFFDETFEQPNSFDLFLNLFKKGEVSETFNTFNQTLNKVFDNITKTGDEATDKLIEQFKRSSLSIREIITGDAIIYQSILDTSIDENVSAELASRFGVELPLQQQIENFTDLLQKLSDETFNLPKEIGRLTVDFQSIEEEITNRVSSIASILEAGLIDGKLTLTQRERLKTAQKNLTEFLDSYKESIKSFSSEDLQQIILTPIEDTLPSIFEELKTGINASSISVAQLRESFNRTFGNLKGEVIDPTVDSLKNLGFEAAEVDKAVSSAIFNIEQRFLTSIQQEAIALSESISLSAKEREMASRKASDVRIAILESEKRRALQLQEEELQRYIKVQNDRVANELETLEKQLQEEVITQQEYEIIREGIIISSEEEINKRKIELVAQTADVIRGIEIETTNEIKNEQLRRLQNFSEDFIEVLDFMQQAGQVTADILQNLSDQQLINLQANFDAQLQQLEAFKNQGILTEREYNFERLKAQEKYELERKRIEKAAWERQYAIQIGQAIINTAVAFTAALAQFPGPPFTIPNAVAAAALGAGQVAVIASQPKPRFADGGLVPGNTPGDSDTINALISPGEFVMNANATKKFLPILKQLNQYDRPVIGKSDTVATPPITDLGAKEPIRAYVVLDELNEKNEVLRRIENENSFFS